MCTRANTLQVAGVDNDCIVCYDETSRKCYDYEFKNIRNICFARMITEGIIVLGLKTGFSIEIVGLKGVDKEIGLCYMNHLNKQQKESV